MESHTVLMRHRKLAELATALRIRRSYAMGHLHALWHAALEQQEDGDLTAWSDEFIADSSDFPGDAPQYVRLLQQHRWLDGRLIHDWLDYSGLFLIKKYSTSNRVRLVEIWLKHGRVYGERGKRTDSEQLPLAPNLTKPNKPNHTHRVRAREPVDVGKLLDQIGSLYGRKAGVSFNYSEEMQAAELARRPEIEAELALVLTYRENLPKADKRYFPQSAASLMGKWDEVLDRIRALPANSADPSLRELQEIERRLDGH